MVCSKKIGVLLPRKKGGMSVGCNTGKPWIIVQVGHYTKVPGQGGKWGLNRAYGLLSKPCVPGTVSTQRAHFFLISPPRVGTFCPVFTREPYWLVVGVNPRPCAPPLQPWLLETTMIIVENSETSMAQ